MSDDYEHKKLKDLWCLREIQKFSQINSMYKDYHNELLNNFAIAFFMGFLLSIAFGIFNVYLLIRFEIDYSTLPVMLSTLLIFGSIIFGLLNKISRKQMTQESNQKKTEISQISSQMSPYLKSFFDFDAPLTDVIQTADSIEGTFKKQLGKDKVFLNAMLVDIQNDRFCYDDKLKQWILLKSKALKKAEQAQYYERKTAEQCSAFFQNAISEKGLYKSNELKIKESED